LHTDGTDLNRRDAQLWIWEVIAEIRTKTIAAGLHPLTGIIHSNAENQIPLVYELIVHWRLFIPNMKTKLDKEKRQSANKWTGRFSPSHISRDISSKAWPPGHCSRQRWTGS
jgi:hypothetical protein